ncbi:hypothetical protein [Winogradskyella pulchriflava]|uniref:Uncharacterized protein n=1 Tax=Winogradskyella pulchriflava TaxID=1110688 RepID=A0ABV6Q8X6_9FLAO
MLKKIALLSIIGLMGFYGLAQHELNNYKYIIVSDEFECQKSPGQYKLNELTAFLFNKYGYKAFVLGKDLPADLAQNKCMALTADVSNDKSGLFKTKLEIELKDCFGKIIMTSEVGESRLKDFERAYQEALRNAFVTFIEAEYKYVETEAIAEKTTKVEETKKPSEASMTKVDTKKEEKETKPTATVSSESFYYAQTIKNGYQLVDSEPKIVMVLLTTAANDVFIVKDKNAIVYKEDGFWYYSENNGKVSNKKQLNIKF